MPIRREDLVVPQVRTLFEIGAVGSLSDCQLLERFLERRDEVREAAFAALLERHGPMVLRVCRGMLRNPHDIDDAFQSTFLVLVRKADSVRNRASVGSWLHGVALRASAEARTVAARRLENERRGARPESVETVGATEFDVRFAIDEELDRLPAHYREPIILCYLEGRTCEEAALVMGLPSGTVKSRLARGRERLKGRLLRRGLSLPAGLGVAELLTPSARAEVAASLMRSLLRSASRTGSHNASTGVDPTSAAVLARRVVTLLFMARLKKAASLAFAVGVVSVGLAVFGQALTAAPPRDHASQEPPPAATVHKAGQTVRVGPGSLIVRATDLSSDFSRDGRQSDFRGTVAIDPDTGGWRTIATGMLPAGPISPDGRYQVFSQPGRDHDADELGIWIYDLAGEQPTRRIFPRNGTPHWSHAGGKVVIAVPAERPRPYERFETWQVNADGTGLTRLPLPETEMVLDVSPDGNWLATRCMAGNPQNQGRLSLFHPDGSKVRHLTEGSPKGDVFGILRFSPEVRQIAIVEVRTIDKVRTSTAFVADIDGRNRRALPIVFEPGLTADVRWSPDGARLAFNAMDGKLKKSTLVMVNANGTGAKTLTLPPGHWLFNVCDWRMVTPKHRVREFTNLETQTHRNSPRARYRALLDEIEKTKPYEPDRYLGRFLALAEEAPNDPVAIDELIWVVQHGFHGPIVTRAIDRLAEHHAETIEVGHAVPGLRYSVVPSTETLIRAVIEKGPTPPIRGSACLTLGRYFKNQAALVRSFREDPDARAGWKVMFLNAGADIKAFNRFADRDPDALLKDAETAFERTIREYGSVSQTEDTLEEEARRELFEMRELGVGKPMPGIEGKDADGRQFTLEEYRGKVVALVFCSVGCGACRNLYEFERGLVQRMRDRPFALLSVEDDHDRDQLRERIKKEAINWRTWWDPGEGMAGPGPISRRMNIDGWPTIYLIDHRGVIRYKTQDSPRTARLNAQIDSLVSAADEASTGPGDP